jgi:hypothetical protein
VVLDLVVETAEHEDGKPPPVTVRAVMIWRRTKPRSASPSSSDQLCRLGQDILIALSIEGQGEDSGQAFVVVGDEGTDLSPRHEREAHQTSCASVVLPL